MPSLFLLWPWECLSQCRTHYYLLKPTLEVLSQTGMSAQEEPEDSYNCSPLGRVFQVLTKVFYYSLLLSHCILFPEHFSSPFSYHLHLTFLFFTNFNSPNFTTCLLLDVLQTSQRVKAKLIPPEICSCSWNALWTTQFPKSKTLAGISFWSLCQRHNIKGSNNEKHQDCISSLYIPLCFSNFGLCNYPNMEKISVSPYVLIVFIFA